MSKNTFASGKRRRLGPLGTGADVTFVRNHDGSWGLEIGDGDGRFHQCAPALIRRFVEVGDVRAYQCGYSSLRADDDVIVGEAVVEIDDGVAFAVADRWSISEGVLNLERRVEARGSSYGGFASALLLLCPANTRWQDAQIVLPAVLYGWPPQGGEHPTRGFQSADTRRFMVREDAMAAPMIAACVPGASICLLDSAPQGDTTVEEVAIKQASVMLDERYRFGSFGAEEQSDGLVALEFAMPGSMTSGGRFAERQRYARIKDGVRQRYSLAIRLGREDTVPELVKSGWRWAWKTLEPAVHWEDLDVVLRALTDQLASTVQTYGGRTAIPWIFSSRAGLPWSRPDDTRAAMGFVGKNIEAADQLLAEGDLDDSARGQQLRELGLAIIDSFIRHVPLAPPAGEGFDLLTGQPTVSFPPSPWRGDKPARVFLRAPSEDLRMLLRAYARERGRGREHDDWLGWVRAFCDWLLTQQRPDGSFPRAWVPGSGEVMEGSGTASYSPVPMLAMLSDITGEARYLAAAERAGEYVWQSQGASGVFVGGTLDNPDVVDKEAGMLALEAFVSLYEATDREAWLDRARAAADFAETWIWIWDVPMPMDATDGELRWKHGVTTIGLQGITANPGGFVDQYMDWSAPAYCRLYAHTGDEHYRDVALILLHNTKAMLAIPGREYDLAGPGWQQEHWCLGIMRGIGGHGGWLPWVTTNHLYSITGIRDEMPDLYAQLADIQPGEQEKHNG